MSKMTKKLFTRNADLSTWIKVLITGVSAFALVVQTPYLASATETHSNKISLHYGVYGQGFKLMDLRLDIELNGRKYTAKSSMDTVGLASVFASFSARYHSTGTINKTKIRPGHFEMIVKKKKKRKRIASYSWTQLNGYKMEQEPPISKRKKAEVNKHLQPSLPDPLSTLLSLALVPGKNPCNLSRRVFDGRKNFRA